MRDEYAKRVVETYQTRFWARVRKGDGCWEWQGHRSPKGYGAFKDAGSKIIPAHRAAYEMEVGPIPAGHVVMHRCDNPPCVNPTHLTTGTVRENNEDRDAKGRQVAPKGSKHGMATITEDVVRAIRSAKAQGVMQAEIARQFGVSEVVVSSVVRRKTWKHVE